LTPTWEQALGRSAIYEFLSLAFMYPERDAAWQLAEKASALTSEASRRGQGDVEQALLRVSGCLSDITNDGLVGEYVDVFGHSVSGECPQYETAYDQAHVFQQSHTLADLNGFYGAFGVVANPEIKERPDHISIELEFMHLLTLKEAYAQLNDHGQVKVDLCVEGQRTFLTDHLAPWIRSFVKRVSRKAGDGSVYGVLAHLLDLHMKEEFQAFSIRPAPSRRTIMPVEQEDDLDCGAEPAMADIPLGG
jgi:DMSO reductase family type II enzyme chaperone